MAEIIQKKSVEIAKKNKKLYLLIGVRFCALVTLREHIKSKSIMGEDCPA